MEIDRETHPLGLANAAGDMRGLVIWYVAYMTVSLLAAAFGDREPYPSRVDGILIVPLLMMVIPLADILYRVARRLHTRYPGLWACSPIIPLFNYIAPVILHGRLKRWLRERGVPVGVFGPRRETVRLLHAAADAIGGELPHVNGDGLSV